MRMRYGRYRAGLLVLGIALLFSIQSEAAAKKTIYNSPYVSFSPDGRAFTTCAGDRNYVWYARDDSTTVYTQIPSSLRDPVVGEHIYTEKRYGEIPVGYWKVVHRPGQCIHNGYTGKNWHGVSFGRQKCMQYYYSGWKAYCADCGEAIEEYNIYMSREAAASIQYLDLGNERATIISVRSATIWSRGWICRHINVKIFPGISIRSVIRPIREVHLITVIWMTVSICTTMP